MEKLYIVAVISNPNHYKRRYQLFEEFCQRVNATDKEYFELITLELQYANRPFQTSAQYQVRSNSVLWHKENLINYAVRNCLPVDWKFMAWIDTDIEFVNSNWVQETLDKLHIYDILQLFTHAIDLGANHQTLEVHTGFVYQYLNNEPLPTKQPYNRRHWHPGYAWAITRQAYEKIGGLLDIGILGSGDNHMAMAFIGRVEYTLNPNLHNNYKQFCLNFQKRCRHHIQSNIGFVNGTILHYFHGCKVDRRYKDRWKILVDNKFDPVFDLKRNGQNIYELETSSPNFVKLRTEMRMYFSERNEDAISLKKDYVFTKQRWI